MYSTSKMKKLSSILKYACKLDLLDACYIYSSKEMNYYSLLKNKGMLPKRRGILVRYLIAIKICFTTFFKHRVICSINLNQSNIFFPFDTKNQEAAVFPVIENLYAIQPIKVQGSSIDPSVFRSRIVSLCFLFHALACRKRANCYQKKMMSYFFDQYLLCYGHYFNASLFFRRQRPSAVLLANDHSMTARVIALAARDAGIMTIYIQHASVSENFPPLLYDYAFLDGKDALRKYLSQGRTQTKIFLAGIPKMDSLINEYRPLHSVDTIGIAINLLDDLRKVICVVKVLRSKFQEKIIVLRPHPALGSDLDMLRDICANLDVLLSDPHEEDVGDFLTRITLLISGESNIHLEATLLNKVSIYYPFGERLDHYGFLEERLIFESHHLKELITEIIAVDKQYPSVLLRAKNYCATIGTSYQGRSSELVAQSLNEIVNSNIGSSKLWHESQENRGVFELDPKTRLSNHP